MNRETSGGGSPAQRIVCFGDSITRGISFVQERLRLISPTYPAELASRLKVRGAYQVFNKGHFNATSQDLLKRVQRDVDDIMPDLVLLEAGANDSDMLWEDVANAPDSPHQARVPLEQFIENMATLVTHLRNDGVPVAVLSLFPLDPARYYSFLSQRYSSSISHWIARCGGIAWWQDQYNHALKSLTGSLHVTWIDVRAWVAETTSVNDFLGPDGVHPTPWGYRAFGNFIAAELQNRHLI